MTYQEIIDFITNNVYENPSEDISGDKIQEVLLGLAEFSNIDVNIFLKKDGSVPMDSNYVPILNKDVVTKEFLEGLASKSIIGQHNPQLTNPPDITEYPNTTGYSNGIWAIEGILDESYIFTAGELIGEEIRNGNGLVWNSSSWSIIEDYTDLSNVDFSVYLKKSESTIAIVQTSSSNVEGQQPLVSTGYPWDNIYSLIIKILSNDVVEYWGNNGNNWILQRTIRPVILDGNRTNIIRQNNNAGNEPAEVEIPNPTNGDTGVIFLTDGKIEYWAYDGAWNLTNTVDPVILDGNDTHISRENNTENIAPTANEVQNPQNGDTAKLKLSNGALEFWSYTSNWSKDFTIYITDHNYSKVYISNDRGDDTTAKIESSDYPFKTFNAAIDYINNNLAFPIGSQLAQWEVVFLGSSWSGSYIGQNVYSVYKNPTLGSLKLVIPYGVLVNLYEDSASAIFNLSGTLVLRGEGRINRINGTGPYATYVDIEGLDYVGNQGGNLNTQYRNSRIRNVRHVELYGSMLYSYLSDGCLENIELFESTDSYCLRSSNSSTYHLKNIKNVNFKTNGFPIVFQYYNRNIFIAKHCNFLTENYSNFKYQLGAYGTYRKFINCKLKSNWDDVDAKNIVLERLDDITILEHCNLEVHENSDDNIGGNSSAGLFHPILEDVKMNKGIKNHNTDGNVTWWGELSFTTTNDGDIYSFDTKIVDPYRRNWVPRTINYTYDGGLTTQENYQALADIMNAMATDGSSENLMDGVVSSVGTTPVLFLKYTSPTINTYVEFENFVNMQNGASSGVGEVDIAATYNLSDPQNLRHTVNVDTIYKQYNLE